MIIGISGRMGSGKDTVGKIIQYLEAETNKSFEPYFTLQEFIAGKDVYNINYVKDYEESISEDSNWEIKKFAFKLKKIVSILTGIRVADLEKQEVKDMVLSPEWQMLITTPTHENTRYTESTVRWLLQTLGTELLREQLHPNVWVNALFSDYLPVGGRMIPPNYPKDYTSGKFEFPNWIITDVRFPNEVKAIKERGGVIWKVVRPCEYCNSLVSEVYSHKMGCERPNKQEHESETALDNYKEFDEIIENNGSIEELTQKVKTAFQKLKQTN